VVRDNSLIIGSNPAAGHPGWDEIGAITEAPETWPPLDWILMFEKGWRSQRGKPNFLFGRFGLRNHIEQRIWWTETYTIPLF